jgi:GH15 family glucan-1,4-alpha-glucosidase
VLRYRTDETDDGLSGKEGSFLITSTGRHPGNFPQAFSPKHLDKIGG